jgi:hypothetical protein
MVKLFVLLLKLFISLYNLLSFVKWTDMGG